MKVRGILETSLYVDDLSAAEVFYTDVLGLAFASRQPRRHVFLRCGQQMLLLFDPRASAQAGNETPSHGAEGAGHVAFSVEESELNDWRLHLKECGVKIERDFAWPQGGRSIYFRDPAGNSLELATPSIWGVGKST